MELVDLNIGEDELKTHSNINSLINSHNAIVSYSNIESFHYNFINGDNILNVNTFLSKL